jgi:hypothetical protein
MRPGGWTVGLLTNFYLAALQNGSRRLVLPASTALALCGERA